MQLVAPAHRYLPGVVDALQRGWSPSTETDLSAELLARIAADPQDVIDELDDRDPAGRTVTLPDGTLVPRLPGITRWLWDGEFAGSINARWAPGTPELPPHVLGHVGYTVVPWKQRRGYATAALGLFLVEVAEVGLPYVEITTNADNVASQRVITANGGVLVGEFDKGPAYHGGRGLRFRIDLG
jgi:predicted acetyltransferase